MATLLDFEKPIAELESKAKELRYLADGSEFDLAEEITKLESRAAKLLAQTYGKLSPWQKTQVARHPDRPHFQDYVEGLIEDFTPLAGDLARGLRRHPLAQRRARAGGGRGAEAHGAGPAPAQAGRRGDPGALGRGAPRPRHHDPRRRRRDRAPPAAADQHDARGAAPRPARQVPAHGPARGGRLMMLRTRDEILARLAALGIEARTYDHPPVFTVEESRQHTRHIPGAHCKNLFLKDKKGALWLVTCADERRVDLNALSKRLGAARFSFGRAELLREVLGVEPGSVTPLAIVNDTDQRVTHVLDEGWIGQEPVIVDLDEG